MKFATKLLLLVGLVSASIPSSTWAADPPPGLTNITIAYTPAQGVFISFLAQKQGFFAKAGLNATFIKVATGAQLGAAVIGGTADLSMNAGTNVIPAMVAGQTSLVVVGPYLPLDFTFVARADLIGASNTFPENVRALKGKTIGVAGLGGASDTLGRQYVRLAGLDPNKDVTFVGVSGPAASSAALIHKQVDAIFANSATTTAINEVAISEKFKITTLLKTLSFNRPEAQQVSMTTRAFVDQKEKFGRYCSAMAETLKWLRDPANFATAGLVMKDLIGFQTVSHSEELVRSNIPLWQMQIPPEAWSADAKLAGVNPDAAPSFDRAVVNCPNNS